MIIEFNLEYYNKCLIMLWFYQVINMTSAELLLLVPNTSNNEVVLFMHFEIWVSFSSATINVFLRNV